MIPVLYVGDNLLETILFVLLIVCIDAKAVGSGSG